MTAPQQQPERDCQYLLRQGMSVLCIDSTDPSRKNCDHCISTQCFATPTPAPQAPSLFQIEPNSHDYTIGQIVEINENIQKQRAEAARVATLKERERVLDALDRNFKGWFVKDAVVHIRRFPGSLLRREQGGGQK